jgi:(p)ppGpp synthase/HD superfamily hydrolase
MSIAVKDVAQLTRLLRTLAGVANVLSARRTG